MVMAVLLADMVFYASLASVDFFHHDYYLLVYLYSSLLKGPFVPGAALVDLLIMKSTFLFLVVFLLPCENLVMGKHYLVINPKNSPSLVVVVVVGFRHFSDALALQMIGLSVSYGQVTNGQVEMGVAAAAEVVVGAVAVAVAGTKQERTIILEHVLNQILEHHHHYY